MSEDGVVANPPRSGRLLGYLVLGAIGSYAAFVSVRLGLWRQSSPGEGLFPFVMAAAMTTFSVIGLVAAWIGKPEPAAAPPAHGRSGLLRVGAYLLALVFYAAALDPFGFAAATIVTIVFILRFAERYSWRATVALTAGTVVGCHLLFVAWLGAILPTGTLWSFLFE